LRTEAALADLINAKRNGKTRKKSLASEAAGPAKGKKPRKAFAGQKEMLLLIEGKKRAAKKAAKPERVTVVEGRIATATICPRLAERLSQTLKVSRAGNFQLLECFKSRLST
jgi:hypothetical protein